MRCLPTPAAATGSALALQPGRLPQELAFEQMQAEAGGKPGPASQLGKRKAIYNAEALHELLEDLEYSQAADWHETQVLTAEAAEPLGDVDDDLSRELSFYEQARPAPVVAAVCGSAGGCS